MEFCWRSDSGELFYTARRTPLAPDRDRNETTSGTLATREMTWQNPPVTQTYKAVRSLKVPARLPHMLSVAIRVFVARDDHRRRVRYASIKIVIRRISSQHSRIARIIDCHEFFF